MTIQSQARINGVWGQSLSGEENRAKAKRHIADSFDAFLDAPVSEDDACA
jgi:hypothetical protein